MLSVLDKVPDETQHIQKIKSQIKLSKKLFCATDIQQFLHILYRETSHQLKVRSLVFCWYSGHFGPFQCVYSKDGCYKKQLSNMWPESSTLGLGDSKDCQYIANELGRPVQKILRLPFKLKKYSPTRSVCLFIEFSMNDVRPLQYFYQSIFSLMTCLLDQLLLTDHLQTGSHLMYSTFNHLEEPLAVLDRENQITSSNEKFDCIHNIKIKEIKNFTPLDFVNQKNIQYKDKVYERQSYPANIEGSTYNIYHYTDITQTLSLQSQMIQGEKMGALGQLGEMIAHQLNNPLTGILLMAQFLLKGGPLNDEIRQDMESIVISVKRSQKIISHLLNFSRTNSQLHPCNLNEAVKNTLPFLKSITSFVDFKLKLHPQPIFVKANLCLLQQVVFNLVKNACQAVVDCSKKSPTKNQVHVLVYSSRSTAFVKVEDSGPGIKEKDYPHIFKPFFTTKNKDQGTGLGLSVSMNIVKSFNGDLKPSRSNIGGACLTLFLPLATGS